MLNLEKRQLYLMLSPLVVSAFLALVIATLFNYLPDQLPLFYSLQWGDGQLVNPSQFYLLPGLITAVTIFNLVVYWQLHPSQIFFRRVLLVTSYTFSLLIMITFLKIIFIFI